MWRTLFWQFEGMDILKSHFLLFLRVIAVCFAGSISGSLASTIVIPNEFTNANGDTRDGLQTGIQYQQVYGGSLFDQNVPAYDISALRFRVDPSAQAFANSPELEVRLFVTQQDPDVARATRYTGSGEITVLPRNRINWSGSPGLSFDAVIPLPNHFVYDPKLGNLVIDIAVHDWGLGPTDFDVTNKNFDQIGAFFGAIGAQNGSWGSAGFVTQFAFEPIPEPSTWILVGIGLVAIFSMRRKRVVT
jgi:hypothetical protein